MRNIKNIALIVFVFFIFVSCNQKKYDIKNDVTDEYLEFVFEYFQNDENITDAAVDIKSEYFKKKSIAITGVKVSNVEVDWYVTRDSKLSDYIIYCNFKNDLKFGVVPLKIYDSDIIKLKKDDVIEFKGIIESISKVQFSKGLGTMVLYSSFNLKN